MYWVVTTKRRGAFTEQVKVNIFARQTFGALVLFKCGPIREHLRPSIKLQSNRTNKYPTSVTYNLLDEDV